MLLYREWKSLCIKYKESTKLFFSAKVIESRLANNLLKDTMQCTILQGSWKGLVIY